MKVTKIMTLKLLLALTVAIGFTSCSKSGSTKGGSSATGWQINDKKGGFQYNTNYKKQETPPGMTSIEGGTFTMGKVEDDVMHDWNNTPTKQHVQSFYMDETEITNLLLEIVELVGLRRFLGIDQRSDDLVDVETRTDSRNT